MCEAVGHPVQRLERVAIAGLTLSDLRPGAYRRLSDEEVAALLIDPPSASGLEQ